MQRNLRGQQQQHIGSAWERTALTHTNNRCRMSASCTATHQGHQPHRAQPPCPACCAHPPTNHPPPLTPPPTTTHTTTTPTHTPPPPTHLQLHHQRGRGLARVYVGGEGEVQAAVVGAGVGDEHQSVLSAGPQVLHHHVLDRGRHVHAHIARACRCRALRASWRLVRRMAWAGAGEGELGEEHQGS